MNVPIEIPEIKILVIGSANVGKSSIALRWFDEDDDENILGIDKAYTTKPTLGVDLKSKIFELDDKEYKITIWDTAGAERFRSFTSAYYRNAHGVIIVYDICDPESFHNLEYWINESATNKPIPIRFVAGNKLDKSNERLVDGEEVYQYLNSIGQVGQGMLVDSYYEVTCKDKASIDELFYDLIIKIVNDTKLIQQSPDVVNFDTGELPKDTNPCIRC